MQKDADLGPAILIVLAVNLSLESIHDPLYRGQTEAGTIFLGRKKGSEEMVKVKNGRCVRERRKKNRSGFKVLKKALRKG